jgi:hypothetical protein
VTARHKPTKFRHSEKPENLKTKNKTGATTPSLSSPRHSTMASTVQDADTRVGTGFGDVEVDLNGITQDSEIRSSADLEARSEDEQDISLVSATSSFSLFDNELL